LLPTDVAIFATSVGRKVIGPGSVRSLPVIGAARLDTRLERVQRVVLGT